MDPNCIPLTEYLGVLPEHFIDWPLTERHVALHIEKELPCNWKLAQEAFIENYHTAETHPQLVRGGGDENTQYDLFEGHVSRFYAPKGVPSTALTEPITQQALLEAMVRDKSVLGPGKLEVPPGGRARTTMAAHLRSTLGETYGMNLSDRSTTEMIDTIEYGLFPNMVLFLGITLPFVYRYRPAGDRPDRSLFEILILRPIPGDMPRPEPADVYRLGIDDSFTTVPGIDPGLGRVFDQDTGNLRLQQEGLAATRKAGLTLGNYQECRIRQFHRILDRYLTSE
jgi:hypothetical protein